MKGFVNKRGASLWLALAAVVLGVAAVFLYQKNGVTEFSPTLNSRALIALWAGAALCLLGLVLNFKPVKVLGYLAYLYALFGFIGSQATYITNIFVSIDGTTFSKGFLMTAAAIVAAVITALVAALLTKKNSGEVESHA